MTQTSYALVTGASRGLGKYFARALAARQQNLLLVARDHDRLATLAVELEKTHGIRAETLALDLAGAGAGGRLAEQLKERGLKIDPENPMLHENIGAIHLDAGRFKQARVEFDRCARDEPRFGAGPRRPGDGCAEDGRPRDGEFMASSMNLIGPFSR